MSTTLKRKVIKYAVLPEFWPRLKALFTSGFAHISYLIAVIYESLNLLPANHPYLNPINKGRFGIRHVIAEAANNLVFSRKNIDQIIVFFTILLGLVLLLSQFVLLGFSIFAQQEVMAGPPGLFPSMFDLFSVESQYGHGSSTHGESQDIAFIIMDRVFGVRDIFVSCVSDLGEQCRNLRDQPIATPGAYPFPFHIALHNLLRFYSMGIFVVSVFIILYFFTTVAAETAATGTPFGQRTNRAWAPVRLILFFAMLAPLNLGGVNGGLNGAQIVTLWVAKGGSNFATNAWGYFNRTLGASQIIEAEELVASPSAPNVSDITAFMFVAKTCQNIEEKATGNTINGYVIIPGDQTPRLLTATNLETIHNLSNKGNIIISFGHHDVGTPGDPLNKNGNNKHPGAVNPLCGQLIINIANELNIYTRFFEEKYYNLVQNMWQDTLFAQQADCLVKQNYVRENNPNCTLNLARPFVEDRRNFYNEQLKQGLAGAVQNIRDTYFEDGLPNRLADKGWAGAALWYNQISEINGAVVGAMSNKPTAKKYPMVMETVLANQRAQNESIPASAAFVPSLSDGERIEYVRGDTDRQIAPVLYMAHKVWDTDSFAQSSLDNASGSLLIDTINLVLGTSGVFSMRENADIHPLAQLSALGKSMMEATVRNLAVGGFIQGIGGIVGGEGGKSISEIGGAIWSLGISMITMSVILYYIIPFMPFIYFMFAVSGWVKGIFEAIVAMPLWAMAHIRIDGEGIPGRDASNGYFLLLEIFLRPVLIVFGLLASTIIFASLIHVLNDIFDLVVSNVGGFDVETEAATGFSEAQEFLRSPIDELFYTAMYVIITYMIGMSCFKLIDLIPNNILRWSGVSVSTFQEGAGDPAGQLTQSVYTGGTLMTSKAQNGILPALL